MRACTERAAAAAGHHDHDPHHAVDGRLRNGSTRASASSAAPIATFPTKSGTKTGYTDLPEEWIGQSFLAYGWSPQPAESIQNP